MLKIRRIALRYDGNDSAAPRLSDRRVELHSRTSSRFSKRQGLLAGDEEEQLVRLMKVQQLSEEAALRRLGKHGEDEITQAVARHANLPYLKINPLDLDLDVVTSALPAPFARKHTMCAVSKHGNTVTLAIANPFNRVAPPRPPAVRRARGEARGRLSLRHRDGEQGFLRPQELAQGRGNPAHRRTGLGHRHRKPGVPLGPDGRDGPDDAARRHRPRQHVDPRLRPEGVGHPHGAEAEHRPGAASHRRGAPRRPRDSQDRLPGGGEPGEDALRPQHRREAAASGRPHQEDRGRQGDRDPRLHHAHGVRREGGAAHLRPRHPA